MNENEKVKTGGIIAESRAEKWLENFWYHYKWHTIIIGFFLVVLLVCGLQMCTREVEDSSILYAGPSYISAEDMGEIERVFESVMPEDADGNGKKTVILKTFHLYTKEQIEEIEAETDEYGRHLDVDNAYVVTNTENFYDYVLAGETSICLLDPSLYENLLASERLAELSEGVFGVTLGETEIYKSYSALSPLPEDTVICLLRQNFVGKNSNDDIYEADKRLLEAIIGYTN